LVGASSLAGGICDGQNRPARYTLPSEGKTEIDMSPLYDLPLLTFRRPRRRQKRTVTLIAGLHCGDHLLLSADSGVYDEHDNVTEVAKLDHHGSFAWGFSGYETLGREFDGWMRANCVRLASLGNGIDLLNEVKATLDRINGNRWQELQSAGVKRESLMYDHFVHVIVAGFVSDHGLITSLTHGQPHQIVTTPGTSPIWLGATLLAEKAYAALAHDHRWTPDQGGLQRLMDLAVTFGHDEENLRQPVRLLRVNRSGSLDVSDERFRKRFPHLDRRP
jgi:hypothetical protein